MPPIPRKRSQPRDVKFLTKFGSDAGEQAATLYDDHQTIEDAFAKLRQEIRDANDDAEIAALDQRIAALEERPEGTTIVNNDNSTVIQGEPTPDELTKDQKDAIKGTVGTPNDNNRFVTDQDPRLNGGPSMPVGSVIDFAGATAPGDWLLCDGSVINQADYPELFTVIGSVYGVVDPVTFGLPDCRGRSTMGPGTTLGAMRVLGEKLGVDQHLLTAAQSGLPQHNHSVSINAKLDTATNGSDADWLRKGTGSPVSGDAGPLNASQAHPNVHPVIVFNKIIKAK